jgi:hypothetical protein
MRIVWLLPTVILTPLLPAAEPNRAGPDWWSLQPIRASVPPEADPASGANPIDVFVRAKLRGKGLQAADPADRLTLIRRVTFDLTGLPPTPGEIDSFLSDSAVDAYEKLVDRLLASPAYGERWARHWLDAVRYSESHGFEYDRLRDNAWRYRDYVIKSFNADKPCADFVREQIAGDVLPRGTRDGVVATGMLVSGPYDQAGFGSASAVIRAKAREDELEDMLGTVSQTFLGVTLNCARCHDHKFDPYTSRDYYRLKAVFAGVVAGDRPANSATEEQARKEGITKLEKRLADLRGQVAQIEAKAHERLLKKRDPAAAERDKTLPKPIARWAFDGDAKDLTGNLHAELKNGAKISGGRLIVNGERAFAETQPLSQDLNAKTLEAWVVLPTLKQGGGGVISVQSLDGRQFDAIVFAERTPLRWMAGSEGFVRTRDLVAADETAKPGGLIHVAITYADDGRITVYRNGRPYGESYKPDGSSSPVTFAAGNAQVIFGMRQTGGGNAFLNGEIDEARLYDFALTPEQLLASFRAGVQRISLDDLRAAMSAADREAHRAAETEITRIEQEFGDLRRPSLTYAANPKQPGPTSVLKRGDVEKPSETVTPGSPAAVKGPPPLGLMADAPEADRRRAFAEWLVHPDNPLTWRVIVNRVWQHHFGEGLVRTPNDFGFNGERPTHPELLDWLAFTFREGSGRLKSLHRLILTSAAYRQSSGFNPKAAEVDADNRLLWRFAPRRLEAEAIRDAMLSVSGKLSREAGGPSFRPFRIETFNSAFYIPFDEDRPDFNRRSVYRMNVTSSRDPVLDVLDCPDPSVKTPRRTSTTTPLQALTLMNNPFTNRMARSFAERVKREAGDNVVEQVKLAYRFALGRRPTVAERDRAVPAVEGNGLDVLAWALLNSTEFAYVK